MRRRAVTALVTLVAVAVIAFFARQWWLELVHARLQDANVYLQAGRDVLEGRDVYSSRAALPYTYPPLWALVCAPLALLPAPLGIVAFAVASGTLCWWVLRRIRPTGSHAWLWVGLAVLSAPIGRSLYLGQVNPFLVALLLVDVVALPVALRGVGTGLAAAIKVTPAFLALPFLVDRDWRSLARTVGTFAVVTGLAFLALPEASRTYWTGLLWQASRVGDPAYPDNQSLLGLCMRVVGPDAATLVARVGTVVVLVLCWRAVSLQQRHHASLAAFTAAGMGAALVSPVSWSHHWIWLVIASALLWRRGRQGWALALLAPLVATPLWLAERVLPELGLYGPLSGLLTSLPGLAGLGCLVFLAARPLPAVSAAAAPASAREDSLRRERPTATVGSGARAPVVRDEPPAG
jgi:alpha-1,2-mannosyltransferase